MSDVDSSSPKERFSQRAAFYARARPGYPQALIDYLRHAIGFSPDWTIADVGCGTGLFTRLLLEQGNTVFAVEPNAAMREMAGASLQRFPKYHGVDGSSEATTLPDHSVDLITVAQAFHWFEPVKTRAEFARVARPGGWCALVWNQRKIQENQTGADFQNFVDRHAQRGRQDHRSFTDNDSAPIKKFFAPADCQNHTVQHQESMDFARLGDYVLSMSHMPLPGDPRSPAMMDELRSFFDSHAQNGFVRFEFDTRVFYGRIA